MAEGAAVPIQTCKLPSPRDLTTSETRETLTTWFATSATFFSRDDNYKRFLAAGETWDPAQAATYGFLQEGEATRLRRTPAQVRDALSCFFDAVSSFFPFPFLSRRFPQSTSWTSMKEMIYEVYNVQLNMVSLLQFETAIKRAPDENFYIFYERIVDYFRQHLVAPNVAAGGYNTGQDGDRMNLSMNNNLVMTWLTKIDKRLPQLVQREYGTQLQGGTQLVALVSRLASDMDSLLSKLEDTKINRFEQFEPKALRNAEDHEFESTINRFQNGGRRGSGRYMNRTADDFTMTSSKRFPKTKRSGRGRGDNFGSSNPRSQLHCAHCQHLSRELKVKIPSEHSPLECENRRVQVRRMQTDNEQQEEDPDYEYPDFDEETPEGGAIGSIRSLSNSSSFQTADIPIHSGQRQDTVPHPNPILLSDSAHESRLVPITHPDLPLSDLTEAQVLSLRKRVDRILTCTPTKAAAPRLLGRFQGRDMDSVIDSGADLNCLDYDFAQSMNVPFKPTKANATGPGGYEVGLAGVTSEDFTLCSDFHGVSVPINLQRAVVVHSLGSDCIIGEPAKQFNGLETTSSRRAVSIKYEGRTLTKPYFSTIRRNYQVARVSSADTVYGGQVSTLKVPADLSSEAVLLFTAKRGQQDVFQSGFYPVEGGHIRVICTSDVPVQVSRSKPLGDLRSCLEIKVKIPSFLDSPGNRDSRLRKKDVPRTDDDPQPRKEIPCLQRLQDFDQIGHHRSKQHKTIPAPFQKYEGRPSESESHGSGEVRNDQKDLPTSSWPSEVNGPVPYYRTMTDQEQGIARVIEEPNTDFRYKIFGTPTPPGEWTEPEIDLDPDGIMPEEAKKLIREVTNEFAAVFTKAPGKYNGYYGLMDNSIQFTSPPAPNTKIYQPNYSEELKQKQADLMDTLISYGVLARPEDVGVIPQVVSPSLLIPKLDPGEYRCVTDFSYINKFIRKYPSTSPTITDAKNFLARKKLFVHLDLSNFFFQSGLSNKCSQWLGTFHPYKGLFVYVVEPQGLKNASEHGYEVLSRVYGDMCKEGRMTRIADSLFPTGDTYEELALNYEETLRRALLCGLTFKPGKVIVCPTKTILFGWELNKGEWKPTTHTTSALVNAVQPSTIKGLRSFLGAFKQFAECVRNYARILHGLEQLVGGRASLEKIVWTKEYSAMFEAAKRAAGSIVGTFVPRPSDTLHTYSDYSADARAVGGRMVINRTVNGVPRELHGGYFSVILDRFKERWIPCEAEAAGIRLVLQHFSPYIRESKHNTIHFTDNLPAVQAWRRCLQGQFSSSSRISTFLTNLSALSVELVYKPGKQLHSADYASRHPQPCLTSSKCQICSFAQKLQIVGDGATQVRSIEVRDILSGKVVMPLIQVKTWIGIQLNNSVLTRLRRLVDTGQHPEKKKTKGENTVLKRLYNMYQAGDLVIRRDGLIVAKARDGHFGGFVIVAPAEILTGVAFALHVKLSHPSKGQLAALMSRYFYCTGAPAIIQTVTDSCVQCRSTAQIPKEFAQDLTEKVEALGTDFSVDVIERNRQKIFLAREKLSQHTWLEIIEDQTASSLRTALIRTILPWTHPAGATVRCDGAAAFSSLATEARTAESTFHDYNIRLEVGRPHNVNKNPIAENAIKEVEKEILRHRPNKQKLTQEDLVVVAKTMNERLRSRGIAAKEVLTRRDVVTNDPKNIQDKTLGQQQFQDRTTASQQKLTRQRGRRSSHLPPDVVYHKGDIIYVRGQMSKHQPREAFIITGFPDDMIQVQKLHSKFGGKSYVLYQHEITHANVNHESVYDQLREPEDDDDDTQTTEQQVLQNPPSLPEPTGTSKRPRGRPRKVRDTGLPSTEIPMRREPQTRPQRSAAKQAQTRIAQSSHLFRADWDEKPCPRQPPTQTASKYYKSGHRPYNCWEDQVETTYRREDEFQHAQDLFQVWEFWEQADWELPDWDREYYDTVELDPLVNPLQEGPVELQPVMNPGELQNVAGALIPNIHDVSSEEDGFASADQSLEEPPDEEPGDNVFQIARNPENPNQVNLRGRVSNMTQALDQVVLQPEVPDGESNAAVDDRTTTRPARRRQLPGKLRDFKLN